MALIKFTQNYRDHSNDTGYQFEFFCDHCGNGYRTSFIPSKLGMAGGFLRAAGSIFGGSALWEAGQASGYVKDSLRGKANDEAFQRAVAEATPHFKQCARCGKWVCPENCWNHQKNMCAGCAPNLAEEAAAIQNEAAIHQMREQAFASDQIRGVVDVKKDVITHTAVGTCPSCGAATQGAKKFCPECGKSLQTKTQCPKCHAEVDAGVKFCGECGNKM